VPRLQAVDGARERVAAAPTAPPGAAGALAAAKTDVARVLLDLRVVFASPTVAVGFDLLITNILSLFVVIELLKSVLEYFENHRIKLTFITDAALVFVLREIMIGLFQHAMEAREVLALAVLILVIGGVRTLAVLFSPDRQEPAERSAP